ncbi:MAG: nucleotide exchange factor GrpE [Candidatus Aminicenantales bacterium]
MPHNESPDDEKNPNVPSADDAAAEKPESSVSDGEPETSAEAKGAGRRKPSEHKDHRENKDLHGIKMLKAEIEELKKEIEDRAAETAAAGKDALVWKDKTLRTLAETDNLRKRLEREKNEYFQFALSDVLKDILHVIDNLERALKAQDSSEGFREGIELIRKQMIDLVTKRGVTPIERTDGKFDPTIHQALLTEEVEGIEEPMVGEELQKGYMLNDRLLRPALVKVLLPRKE